MVLNFLWNHSREASPSRRRGLSRLASKARRRQSIGPQIVIPSLQDLLPAQEGQVFEGGDDEQEELRIRFEAEGLRSDELTDAKKLVTVWRWLVDSETNVSSLRNQLDKLHKQQSAEMKEVESYIEHIQSLFEEKVSRVQFDNRALRRELDQRGATTDGEMARIRQLLQQHCGSAVNGGGGGGGGAAHTAAIPTHQHTVDNANSASTNPATSGNLHNNGSSSSCADQMTLAEQVAFVLADRERLKEQLDRQRERELRLEENRKLYNNLPQSMKLSANASTIDGNISDQDSDSCSNQNDTGSIGSTSSSEGDYARIRNPPRSPPRQHRHSRIDNTKRTSQLTQPGEDSVKRNIRDPGNIKPMIADKQWIKNLLQEGVGSPTGDSGCAHGVCDSTATDETNANNRLQSRIDTLADRLVSMEKTNRQLELDNETLGFKLSEALVQCDELEQRLRSGQDHQALSGQQGEKMGGAGATAGTPTASGNRGSAGSRSQPESPVKQSFMQTLDNRWLSPQDAGLMEHCKKLHKEVVSLQDQLYQTSQKLEALTVRYQEKKIKLQERIHTLREQHRVEVALLGERIDRLQLELKGLHDEKKKLLKSLLEREGGLVTRAPDAPPKDHIKDIKDDDERRVVEAAQPTRL